MSNAMKKQDFPIACDRIFTRQNYDAYELLHFTESDGEAGALEHPDNWSAIAVETWAEDILSLPIPAHVTAVEENTVPSWLWRHGSQGPADDVERSVQHIFTRIVGAAAYKAWKEDLFGNEQQARNFYDEARYALAQRFCALEPKLASQLGRDWAYGQPAYSRAIATTTAKIKSRCDFTLTNQTIDAMVSGDRVSQGKIHKALLAHVEGETVSVAFPDIAQDWQAKPLPATAALDLMAFRHNDGTLNIEALRHAVKLLVTLLDLHEAPVHIGFVNLAPLLMALALPYDSDAARHFAASITALITAEAYATSAGLAALRGKGADFIQARETVMRNLRNHRRAAHGDRNDYEKLSVLPAALELKKSPDLALAAAAQHRWDDVLELARQHGLRHTHVTTTIVPPVLALFMESRSLGLEGLARLTALSQEGETFSRAVSPVVTEALARLGYSDTAQKALARQVAGCPSLAKAPAINHASLQARGFTAQAIEALDNYLPQVNDIRLAFTPWILGKDFCRKALKISAADCSAPTFNLLHHLGFDDKAIAAANAYCYGQDSLQNSSFLKPQHQSVFVLDADISPQAKIRMAAAAQSFITGTVALTLKISAAEIEQGEKLLLGAWRQGLQAVAFLKDANKVQSPAAGKSKRATPAFLHTQAKPALPSRRIAAKATRQMVSLKTPAAKSLGKDKSK